MANNVVYKKLFLNPFRFKSRYVDLYILRKRENKLQVEYIWQGNICCRLDLTYLLVTTKLDYIKNELFLNDFENL